MFCLFIVQFLFYYLFFFIVLEAFQKLQAKTHPLKFVTT